jgi:hypothetical protein
MQCIVCQVRKHGHGKMLAGSRAIGEKKTGHHVVLPFVPDTFKTPGPFNNSGWLLEEHL